jgi:hypothetical protein
MLRRGVCFLPRLWDRLCRPHTARQAVTTFRAAFALACAGSRPRPLVHAPAADPLVAPPLRAAPAGHTPPAGAAAGSGPWSPRGAGPLPGGMAKPRGGKAAAAAGDGAASGGGAAGPAGKRPRASSGGGGGGAGGGGAKAPAGGQADRLLKDLGEIVIGTVRPEGGRRRRGLQAVRPGSHCPGAPGPLRSTPPAARAARPASRACTARRWSSGRRPL